MSLRRAIIHIDDEEVSSAAVRWLQEAATDTRSEGASSNEAPATSSGHDVFYWSLMGVFVTGLLIYLWILWKMANRPENDGQEDEELHGVAIDLNPKQRRAVLEHIFSDSKKHARAQMKNKQLSMRSDDMSDDEDEQGNDDVENGKGVRESTAVEKSVTETTTAEQPSGNEETATVEQPDADSIAGGHVASTEAPEANAKPSVEPTSEPSDEPPIGPICKTPKRAAVAKAATATHDSVLSRDFDEVDEEEGDVCAICLSGYEDGEKVISAKRCPHLFHKDCILEWLDKNNCCPCCRTDMITHTEIHKAATTIVGKTRMCKAVAAKASARRRAPQQPRSNLASTRRITFV